RGDGMHDPSKHRTYAGSSPRSSSPAATQPFDASTTLAGNAGSPIAADKIYRARNTPPLALLVPCDGSPDVRLPLGVHRLGVGCALLGEITDVSAEIVVLASAYAQISDSGSRGGVFLGHRRMRLARHVRYALTDGRLVHLGGHSFWFRDLQHCESRSPTPPWRRSTVSVHRGSPALAATHSDLEEDDDALHDLGLTQQMDAISREMLGSSAGALRRERVPGQQLLLAMSPPLLVPIDLQRAHVAESQVRLLTQDGFTQDGFTQNFGAEDSLRLDDLRVAESPRDDDVFNDEPAVDEPTKEKEEKKEKLVATQPVSPAQQPPDLPVADELRKTTKWLPRASPLVYASRTVLTPGATAAYPYDFGGMRETLERLSTPELAATQPESCDEQSTEDEHESISEEPIKRESPVNEQIAVRINQYDRSRKPSNVLDSSVTLDAVQPIAMRPKRQHTSVQPTPRPTRALRSTGSENHDARAVPSKPQRTRARPLNLVSTGSSSAGQQRTPRTPRTPVRLSGNGSADGFPELAPLPTAPMSARATRPPRLLPPAKQRRHTLAPSTQQQTQQLQSQTQQLQQTQQADRYAVEIDLSSSPLLPPPEALLAAAGSTDRSSESTQDAIHAPVVVLRPPPLQKPRRMTRRTSASLRDSLSRLPGAKGVARTQLTSKRRRVLHQATPPLPSTETADSVDSVQSAEPMNSVEPMDSVETTDSVDSKDALEPVPPPARFTLATLTGFANAAEQRRATQQLRSRRSISVTEDPMLADICVSGGPLARKLKVLCALARGIPLVDTRWITATDSSDPVDDYLLESPDVEALWGVSVRETLAHARARSHEDRRLLSGFCVHIDESVTEAQDISVLVCAAGAYVLGVQRVSRRGSAEPHEYLGSSGVLEHAGWSTTGSMSDESSSSTEPDDDADSDWDAKAEGRVHQSRGRRRPRKTLPRLSEQPKMRREPSLVLAAPATVSRSTSATSLAKRRRIDSPRLESADGTLVVIELLRRQREEMGVPESARLLVVMEQHKAVGVREQWVLGGALVVTPEDIIQSVLRCELTFVT
ncbi:Mediator of DNA damage checkpoint protein 1, partial [Coemansia sp. RSA 2603]